MNRKALVIITFPGDFGFKKDRLFASNDEPEEGGFPIFRFEVEDRDFADPGCWRDDETFNGNYSYPWDFDVFRIGYQCDLLFANFCARFTFWEEFSGSGFIEEFSQRALFTRCLRIDGKSRGEIYAQRFDCSVDERLLDRRGNASRRERR